MTKVDVWKEITSKAIKCESEVSLSSEELDYFISLNPDLVREILSLNSYTIMELAIKTAFTVHDQNQYLLIYHNSMIGTEFESAILLSGPMLYASQNKEQDLSYVVDVFNKLYDKEKDKVKQNNNIKH